jgi:chromosome partitioning protein
VRKLLVASQKGGVGKTTTSMNLAAAAALYGTRVLLLDADPLSNISTALNLAEHPHRQSLRQAGVELPGVLVTNIVPGLDVFSPYEEGRCSDEDLNHLLDALSTAPCQEGYGCVVVDVPPFMGANPAQLVSACDEFILVMRAEAMAYRTLPAFMELVQRSSRPGHTIQMRGILLTLPEGEEPGACRWERELRGRFGARVLPEVIPHDETIGKALKIGQICSQLHPDSPSARQYRALADKLGLADEEKLPAAAEHVTEMLREAARAAAPALASAPVATAPTVPVPEATDGSDVVDFFAPPSEPKVEMPPVAPTHRVRRLGRSENRLRPSRSERNAPPAFPAVTPSERMTPAANAAPPVAPPAPPPPAPAVPVAAPVNPNWLGQLWPLWIFLGAVLGCTLRFMPLDHNMLPLLVGLGVAALMIFALRSIMMAPSNSTSASWDKNVERRRNGDRRKSGSRADGKNVADRLSAIANGNAKNKRREKH